MQVRSALRVVDIFEALAEAPGGLGISELSRRLSIPKSSTHNLVATLLQRRYLERTPAGHFVLGGRLFDVGVCARIDSRLQTVSSPVMRELMEKVGESVFLGILSPDFEILYVSKVVSSQPIRYDADITEKRPAHTTALGKLLLAHLPEEQLAHYFASKKRERFTSRTVVGREALRTELAKARRSGIGVTEDERVRGASAIAAPIRAASGRIVAGIVVAGPTSRMLARRQQLIPPARAAAAQISAALGFAESAGSTSDSSGQDGVLSSDRGERRVVRSGSRLREGHRKLP